MNCCWHLSSLVIEVKEVRIQHKQPVIPQEDYRKDPTLRYQAKVQIQENKFGFDTRIGSHEPYYTVFINIFSTLPCSKPKLFHYWSSTEAKHDVGVGKKLPLKVDSG